MSERTNLKPLTVGTAGHIDHGKSALVAALTGVDTYHLPEERSRGMTIALGYAPLVLPSGRRLSLVDVPGHERLVRTMVAGATGMDLFLLAVAADDGVMPQTLEHVRVLKALGVDHGVVAVTKSDLTRPALALEEVAALLPGVPAVGCSARTGRGVADVAAALDVVAAKVTSRAGDGGPTVLHIDRVFTIQGAGTVVTGTLSAGAVSRGDRLTLLPARRAVRVRGVQVHDQPVDVAAAGQRVAINLSGIRRENVSNGDVLTGSDSSLASLYRIDVDLTTMQEQLLASHERVMVHHGTRNVTARLRHLGGRGWQLRCEQPLIAAPGDRFVIRRLNPPETIAGGVISHVGPKRSLHAQAQPPLNPPTRAAEVPSPVAAALERRLREAGFEPPHDSELGDVRIELAALVAAGRVVRIGRSMHAHVDAVAEIRRRIEELIRTDGSITLARARDELGTSRKYARALLEHLDAARVTRRRDDDSRVLRGQR